jgi:zinc/manganese transport system substrate-binding protein
MKRLFLILLLILTFFNLSSAKLKVVATTRDLASIASFIGKDRIELDYIAKGYQDPHFVDPKPSYLLKLRDADLLVAVGLELEVGWLPALIKDSRNSKIISGQGYLDASQGVQVLEKPTGQITRAEGDVHPFGNPHYWLDPENGKIIARNIAEKLSQLDPANSEFYQINLDDFQRRIDEKLKEWQKLMEPFQGAEVITYHRTRGYFANRFGLVIAGEIEPKPGIPPTPSHTLEIINRIKADKIKVILAEPFYDLKTPESIALKTGAKVLVLPSSVGGVKGAEDYFQLFDYNINLLIQNLR